MNDNRQNDTKQEVTGIVDCFVISMFSPKEYDKLIRLTAGKTTIYMLLLVFLASFIQYGIPVLSAVAAMGGVRKIIVNEIPDFKMEKGKFYLSEKYEKHDEQAGVYMIVDTDVKKYTKEDIPANAIEAIMVSQSNILVYNSITGIGGMVQENKFSDFKDIYLDNESLAEKSSVIWTMMFAMFAIMWCFMVLKYTIVALFYSFMIMIFTRTLMNDDVTFGQIYKTALFAGSIGTIVVAVTYCIGSSLFIMAGGIFNIFITVAIMNRALILNARERAEGENRF